jgi:single-strand DNA-binding protein
MGNLNFNQVIIGGRITADIECKTTTTGKSVASFTIAVNGRNNETTFINCQAWEKIAELISSHFKKGSSILVVGSLQVRTWNDNNGNKRYATEVLVREVHFVDSRSDSINAPQSTETYNPYTTTPPIRQKSI